MPTSPFREADLSLCDKAKSVKVRRKSYHPCWNSTFILWENSYTYCRETIFSFHSLLSNEGFHSFCPLKCLFSDLFSVSLTHYYIEPLKKNTKYKVNFPMSWPALNIYHFREDTGENRIDQAHMWFQIQRTPNTNPLEGTEWYYRGSLLTAPGDRWGTHPNAAQWEGISTKDTPSPKASQPGMKPHCYHPFPQTSELKTSPQAHSTQV